MRVLLVGGGGREHVLAWAIARSPLVEHLYAAPGNPGIARHAKCLSLGPDAHEDLLRFAESERVDFVVIGPEAPLVAGLADRCAERGIAALGPGAAGAALEGSKAFAKDLMARHDVPTARYRTFTSPAEARDWCRALGAPLVVKADGLAAGKGAIVCATLAEADEAIATCMERRAFGAAGATVVVEEFLRGEEVSFFVLANGADALPLGAAQDHKRVRDHDEGPNTGGMGAYAPVPLWDTALERRVMDTIVRPTLGALRDAGAQYRGVLFVGLMITAEGPKVVEFNCRFGDPECQVIVPRLAEDLLPLLVKAARGEALPARVALRPAASVCVTLASGGYPGSHQTGLAIDGLEAAEGDAAVRVFHAGTAERDGRLVTAGGRVLSVTAIAADLDDAIARAYAAAGKIHFEGMHYRRDIGARALRR